MPAIDPVKTSRTAPKPKKRAKVNVTVPDRADPTRSRQMPTVTPDQADRQRSTATKRNDARVVAKTVRESRVKAIRKENKKKGQERVKILLAPVRAQQGSTRTVSASEAAKLRKQGKVVRVQTRAERNDVGATVRSIGGGGGGLTRAPQATLIGIAKDPGKALPATAKGFRDALIGIPSSIVSTITDPVGTAKGTVADYKRRYGDLGKPGGVEKTADRISKEGAAGEILDATILTTGVGGAAGRALMGPARAGKLGAKLEKVATEERPAKRVSGGKVVPQDKSKNLIVAAAQARHDTKRLEKNQRKVGRVENSEKHRKAEAAIGVSLTRDPKYIAKTTIAGRGARIRKDPDSSKGREYWYMGEDGKPIGYLYVSTGRRPDRMVYVDPAHRRKGVARKLYEEAAADGVNVRSRNQRLPQGKAFTAGIGTRRGGSSSQRVDALRLEAAEAGQIPVKGKVARRMVAGEKGRDLERMKREQSTEVDKGTRRALAGLTKDERAGFKVAMQLGIPADAAVARRVLAKRRADIAKAREAEGVTVPKVLAKSNDELAIIDRLIRDADKVFTPRLKAVVKGEQARERRVSRSDPGLDATQAELSRYAAQAQHLGVRRGDPDRKPEAEPVDVDRARASLEDEARLGLLEIRRATAEPGSAEYKRILADIEEVRKRVENPQPKAKAPSKPHDPDAPESDAQFVARVKAAAAREGLEEPGYFHSQKRPRAGNADRAIGGTRAVAGTKRREGHLFRTGREDNSPLVHEQAIAKNIKRKYNWNRVADNFDQHSFAWSRNKTASELLDELDTRGIDPESVALWNPRLYRDQRSAREMGEDAETTGRGEEPVVQGLDEAVDASTVAFKRSGDGWEREGHATDPRDFQQAGWSLIPRAVYDEIHSDTRPSGAIARGYDILKGKQSRILLGLSPAWLQFQVVSNGLLSGLAGTGPADFAKAQVWWNKLPDEQKAAIEPFIGAGSFNDSIQQTKLGAARTRSEKVNQMIDAYRAMKTTPFMQKVGRGNPLDMLFRVDQAQNNAFRKAVIYSQVKRDAYKRMGENTKRMAGLQTRFMHTLDLGPTKIMEEIVKDNRALERHAQHVQDFLGDYSTFTAAERRGAQRAVMFYGFLRFSLRFTFMTMPIKHPVMSGILAQLGRMQVEEVRQLLGGDELPWAMGKLYFTKDGKLKSIDLARANPAMNAITNFRGPKDVLGFLPPIAGAVLDQAYAKSGFKQREWRVEGENQPRKGQDGYGVENRARIFLNQMLSLAAPYRAALNATQPGPKGDDSLLGSARPTGYKDPQTVSSIARGQANKPQTVGGRLLQDFVPLIPRNDDAPELAASIRARNGQDTGSAPRVVSDAPAPAPEQRAPTAEDLRTELRRRMSSRAGTGASSADLERRRRMSQR